MAKTEYLRVIIKVLTFCGFCPIPDTSSTALKVLHTIFKNVFMYSLIVYSVQITLDLLLAEKNSFAEVGMKLLNISIFAQAAYNIVYFRRNSKLLLNLFEIMNTEFIYTADGVGFLNMSHVNRKVKLLTTFWISYVVSAVIVMFVQNLLTSERMLCVPAWYPYDWSVSPFYELTMALQGINNIFMGLGFSETDVFIASSVYTTIGQFRILESNFRNVVFTALEDNGLSKERVEEFSKNFNGDRNAIHENIFLQENVDIIQIMETESFKEILTYTIKKYIKQFIMLSSYCENVENFLFPILLFKVQSVTFFIIFLTFEIVTLENNSLILALVVYIIACLGQLVFFCDSGELLRSQMNCIMDSLYECPWYLCPMNVKKLILFTMMRCRKPLRLTAGKIVVLSWETFIKIMHTAFSYFTVLRQTMQD